MSDTDTQLEIFLVSLFLSFSLPYSGPVFEDTQICFLVEITETRRNSLISDKVRKSLALLDLHIHWMVLPFINEREKEKYFVWWIDVTCTLLRFKTQFSWNSMHKFWFAILSKDSIVLEWVIIFKPKPIDWNTNWSFVNQQLNPKGKGKESEVEFLENRNEKCWLSNVPKGTKRHEKAPKGTFGLL